MSGRLMSICAGVALTAALAGCSGGSREAGVCANTVGTLDDTAFVFVEKPRSGARVSSGFRVTGCSSTFEATVNWRLRARDGAVLASGFTGGGGREPGPFAFTVRYPSGSRQVGMLEVFEPAVTSEGFPPSRNVLPLVIES